MRLEIVVAPAKFGVEGELATRVAAFAESVRGSKPASGVERVHAPGDVERARREANAGTCPLPADVFEKLVAAGQRFGVPAASLTTQ